MKSIFYPIILLIEAVDHYLYAGMYHLFISNLTTPTVSRKFSTILLVVSLFCLPVEAQITADLDSVTVTASRITTDISESGKSVSVYTAEDIRRLPVTSVDDLLRNLPGVNLNSRSGFGVQSDVGIRGTTFSQVLFLLDTTPLNDPLTGHYNTNIPVSLSEIGQIELIRGPASASYGPDAVGGVIHIKTKMFMEREISRANPGETLTTLQADLSAGEYGLFMTDGSAGIEKEKWRLTLSGRDSRSDGEQIPNPVYPEDQLAEKYYNTHFQLSNISLAATSRVTDRLTAYLRTGYDQRSFNARYFYTRSTADMSTEEISAKWVLSNLKYSMGNQAMEVQISYRSVEDLYDFNPDVSPANLHQTERFHLNASHSISLNPAIPGVSSLRILSGIQHRFNGIESTDRGDHSDRNTGIYSVSSLNWENGISLTGSARLELNRTNSLSFLPQISASWKRGNVTYRSSVGRAIRFGDFTERYVSFNLPDLTPLRNIGNPDLKPETSVTFDLGADWRSSRTIRLSPTLFIRSSANLIDYSLTTSDDIHNAPNLLPGEFYFYAGNISKAVTKGAEFQGYFQLAEGARFNASTITGYTWLHTSDKGDSVSRYIANHPSHQLQWSLNLQINRLSVYTLSSLHVRSPQGSELAGAEIPRSYFVANMKLGYSLFSDRVQIYTDILNITNTSYQEILGAPMPGRWVRAGVQLNLQKR